MHLRVLGSTLTPSTHNLWPFEIIIAGGIGLAAATVGVGASRLLQRATRDG